MKKRKFALMIIAAAFVIYGGSRVYLMNCSCKMEPFESELFTQEQINDAMEISLKASEESFEKSGCNIIRVYYAGDNSVFDENTIQIYTDFYAGFFVPAQINRNYIEKDWKYTLKKQDDGGWIIISRGRC